MPGPGEVRVRPTMSGANPGREEAAVLAGLADGVRRDRVARRRRRGHRGGRLRRGPGPGGPAGMGVRGPGPAGRSGPRRRPPWCPRHWPSISRTRSATRWGACAGHSGITAHRAVFADGPVCGQAVLVHGVRGSVSSLAAQLARWAGATVTGAVRTDAGTATSAGHVVLLQPCAEPAAGPGRGRPHRRGRAVGQRRPGRRVTRNGTVITGYAGPRTGGPAGAGRAAAACQTSAR